MALSAPPVQIRRKFTPIKMFCIIAGVHKCKVLYSFNLKMYLSLLIAISGKQDDCPGTTILSKLLYMVFRRSKT